MNLPKLAIERPVFMSCVVILIMVLGIMGYMSLGVDIFPDVSFPFVFVTTPYQGASPEEIETQISKPLEDELSTLQGVKKVDLHQPGRVFGGVDPVHHGDRRQGRRTTGAGPRGLRPAEPAQG